jgi:hypothetical protein
MRATKVPLPWKSEGDEARNISLGKDRGRSQIYFDFRSEIVYKYGENTNNTNDNE